MKQLLSNIYYFIQGKLREKFYYHPKLVLLLPLHIFEQISYRIFVMDKECWKRGSCKICGCQVPSLQMANKACPKPCYPKMMNKRDWATHKYFHRIEFKYREHKQRRRDYELRITHKTT